MATAELELQLKARNLANGAIDDLNHKLKDVGDTAESSGGRFGKLGALMDSIPFGRIARAALDLVLGWKPVRDIMDKVGAVIGEKLAPVMAKITTWIDAHLIPAIGKLADFLGPILGKAIDVVAAAFDKVIIPAIEGVIHVISILLGKIGDAIGALQHLGEALGNAREQNRGHDPIGDFLFPGSQSGGWVGLHGPEIRRVGETGPEYVSTTHQSMQNRVGPGYVAVAISERDIARMVDERFYFTLRRAAPTSGRV